MKIGALRLTITVYLLKCLLHTFVRAVTGRKIRNPTLFYLTKEVQSWDEGQGLSESCGSSIPSWISSYWCTVKPKHDHVNCFPSTDICGHVLNYIYTLCQVLGNWYNFHSGNQKSVAYSGHTHSPFTAVINVLTSFSENCEFLKDLNPFYVYNIMSVLNFLTIQYFTVMYKHVQLTIR